MNICPHCKQFIPPEPEMFANTPALKRVYEYLHKQTGGVSMNQIVEAVWPDPDTQPDTASNALHVHFRRINEQIGQLGLVIASTGGQAARYKLCRIEETHIIGKRVRWK